MGHPARKYLGVGGSGEFHAPYVVRHEGTILGVISARYRVNPLDRNGAIIDGARKQVDFDWFKRLSRFQTYKSLERKCPSLFNRDFVPGFNLPTVDQAMLYLKRNHPRLGIEDVTDEALLSSPDRDKYNVLLRTTGHDRWSVARVYAYSTGLISELDEETRELWNDARGQIYGTTRGRTRQAIMRRPWP